LKRVIIIYDTKHGNTKIAAEKILEGIKENGEFETSIGYVKDVDLGKIIDYNAIVLGAPNHMGRPSRTMKRFVDNLVGFDLKARDVAVFGTYAGKERQTDRAVKKLQHMLEEKLPKLTLVLPGLSIRVNGIPGPIFEGELPKCLDFGKKIAEQLEKED